MTITDHVQHKFRYEGATYPSVETASGYGVAGLQNEVEILVDRWGVPHIYAASSSDAYVAQGFQAARDRLFQIDLWRRRGLGQLAEVFGPRHVKQDRATRLFLYRGDMRAEWLSYSTNAKDIVTSFVTGINAFIDWAMADPENRLPPEFSELNYSPARWSPEDVVRIRTHGLLFNAEQELARTLTTRELGTEAESLRAVREPESSHPAPDIGAHKDLADHVLDVYRLAFAPVDFGVDGASEQATPSGSNNWVVSAERSATGRPLLANDPHRAVTLPSLRYLAHLEAPGLSVIGAGEPNLPGISIGHNQDVAFGLTIWGVDQEDLYVYELHPEDDTRYLYDGAWEKFDVVEETSAVADTEDVVHTLQFTRHGPVVHVDLENRQAVAVRAVWLEPGTAPYLASLEFQNARNAEDFRRSLRRWGAPGVNMVYATTEGDIGWQASALVPRRPGWDGSLPVPGDGRYEWDGFATIEELPTVHNPESGWFASANQNNLPEDHDNDALTITTDWYSSTRQECLIEWFNSGASIDIESSLHMQTNANNLHGRRLLTMLKKVEPTQCQSEWVELQNWDGSEDIDSYAALLFQVWQRRHLRPWLVDRCLERLAVESDAAAASRHRLLRDDSLFTDLRPDLRMVELFDLNDARDLSLLSDGIGKTLRDAVASIKTLLGEDQAQWTWGNLHQTRLRHPVLHGNADLPEGWGSLPGVPRAGSGGTIGLAGYDADFNAVMGSSFRLVMDVGEWDQSRVTNAPGQSGDPRSPHYSDLLPMWANDESFPLLYSRTTVEEATAHRILLTPENGE